MTHLQTRIGWGALLACTAVGVTLTTFQPEPASPAQQSSARSAAQLMPASTVLYVTGDGSAVHKAAWEKTAAYEAMYKSGLADAVGGFVEFLASSVVPGGIERNPEMEKAVEFIDEHGVSVAVGMDERGMPRVTLVLHDAQQLEPMVAGFARQMGGAAGLQFEQRDVSGRSVTAAVVPNSPGIEVAIWNESKHLVVALGVEAAATTIATAKGEKPNITTNAVWKKYQLSSGDSERISVAWMDFVGLRERFGGMPLPPPFNATVGDFLKALGLHNLNTLAFSYGYKGRATWTEIHGDTEGPRSGLLALTGDGTLSLKDLPPLPSNAANFAATSVDPAVVWDNVLKIVRDVAAITEGDAETQIDQGLAQVNQMLGFDVRDDLLDAFGDVLCVYGDPNQGLFGTGTGFAMKVDDEKKLRDVLSRIFEMGAEASRGDFAVRTVKKHGRQIWLLRWGRRADVGALMIDGGWMVGGLLPQTVEAFAMRVDGKLPTWKPSAEQAAALAQMPKSFQSISLGDPRGGWSTLIKIAPALLIGAEIGMKEEGIIPEDVLFPISVADIPPAELVVKPLFPNVTVGYADDGGLHSQSRQSLPGIPFLGGGGEGSSVATAGVLVALLLPAIQQAREAARRTQSKNNLKNLALAMHNYADAHKHFPEGTIPNEKLKPDQRLSWLVSLLPYIEQNALYERMDREDAWNEGTNEQMAQTRIAFLINPSMGEPGGRYGSMHYVGVAGVGKDAPELAKNHRRAGIFGHNRKTRFADIIDGTSNTMMFVETSDSVNWAQGGTSYRAFTRKPYINGPDRIGGRFRGGFNTAMADGSVRFVSENTDPSVIEALATMAGREIIDNDF